MSKCLTCLSQAGDVGRGIQSYIDYAAGNLQDALLAGYCLWCYLARCLTCGEALRDHVLEDNDKCLYDATSYQRYSAKTFATPRAKGR